MAVLTKYDITGIQNFIFNSQKLMENIGASNIIHDVLHKLLPEALGEGLEEQVVLIDWKNNTQFGIKNRHDIKAEIVYIGGGNAIVVYRDREIEKQITKSFYRKVFENAYTLHVVSASIDTNLENFRNDMEYLKKELSINKQKHIKSHPLYGIAITKLDSHTGLPIALLKDNTQNISIDRILKRTAVRYNETLKYIDNISEYTFPKEFDHLGRSHNESSFIGVVHIDGNGMAKYFHGETLKSAEGYEESILQLRNLSIQIDNIYKNAFAHLTAIIEKNINQFEEKGLNLAYDKEAKKKYLPIRPIIINGDDITFVCDGRIALSAAEKFLKYINEVDYTQFGMEDKLSACGGVAIVKSHFPFSTAYGIAEECCASAKSKSRELCTDNQIKSWLDYQVCFSGIIGNLDSVRDDMYKVKDYNLLWRPWLIGTFENDLNNENDLNFECFKRIYHNFSDSSKWPRNKIKELRNAFLKGKEEVQEVLSENESRGRNLINPFSDVDKKSEGFIGNSTPYFDVLELMDMYIDLKEV